MMENKGKYFVYYNIINNTYCIDSRESSDDIGKNFVNIGKIELTQEEKDKINKSNSNQVYIKKENEEARKNIYGKVEGFIKFDDVEKAIAQLCYNFKVNENYKYNFKAEKEIQIKEEEINENGEITTGGEKINIYSIKYKKFEELCNNLLEIINNPHFKGEESNTNFLIDYTVGLEKIIIDKIIEVGEESIEVGEKKKKIYSLLDYFSEKLLNIYNEIKETKNYGKVIYINCLFSIYDKILESRNINEEINYSTDCAYFFRKNVIKKILDQEKQEHFYVYEILDKEMENSSEGENFDKNYYIVKSKEKFLNANKGKEYKYVKEIHIVKDDQEEYEKMPGFGFANSIFSIFNNRSLNPFGKDATVKKFIPKNYSLVKNTFFTN